MSLGDTVKPPAFSNGTMWEIWSYNYCDRCWHDRAARKGDYDNGCELIALGMAHIEVPQWVEAEPPRWVHCIKFTPDDDGPDEGPPQPQPTPPGQTQLLDASEYDWDRESTVPVAGGVA